MACLRDGVGGRVVGGGEALWNSFSVIEEFHPRE